MQEKIDIRLPRVLNQNMREVRRPRPIRLGYELNMMPLSKAELELTLEEAVNVGEFVELYDVGGSIGIFRVSETDNAYSRAGTMTAYLRHALVTLSDGVIFGYKEYGGTGVNIRTVLTQLLALQPRPMWTLGVCEFDTEFQYSFENEDLLTAILSIAEPLTADYQWTYDTSVFPFVLNLIKAPAGDMSEMRMNRNADNVKINVDTSELCTRMYPLGYGEGVNQLTIAEVNNGIKYLDADTVGTWGLVESTYAETTVTEAATLKSMAESVLEMVKNPTVTVTVKGLDVYSLTGEPMDRFYVGRYCRVPLPDYGIALDERVVSIKKDDVYGNNANVTVVLANQVKDSVTTLSNLTRRAAIGELYSQGSTNQYALSFADNADASYPAEMRFYIDQDAVWINKVVCRYDLEAFRSYSKGAAAGGGQTTSAGGGGTAYTQDVEFETPGGVTGDSRAVGPNTQLTAENHEHDILGLKIDIGPLAVKSDPHVHIGPVHEHADNPGIYRGSTASSVSIAVDGTTVPASAIVNGEFDAVPYLKKDDGGRILRGTWHKITITPNALTRVVADLHVKTFIRSISGGNY